MNNYLYRGGVCLGILALQAVFLLAPSQVHSQAKPTKFTVTAWDDAGKRLEGATVHVAFIVNGPRLRFEETSQLDRPMKVYSDTLGIVIIRAEKEGYYPSNMNFQMSINDANTRYEPWDYEYRIVLRKKANPRPLMAGRVALDTVPGKTVGIDIEKRDRVAPYGDGKQADIFMTAEEIYHGGEHYSGVLVFTFPSPHDGIIPVSDDETGSQLRLGGRAPETGYQPSYRLQIGTQKGADGVLQPNRSPTYDEKKDLEGFWFRIQTEVDPDTGAIVSARYGKIINAIQYGADYRKHEAGFRFSFLLSPDANNRSLEWSGESLFEDPELRELESYR